MKLTMIAAIVLCLSSIAQAQQGNTYADVTVRFRVNYDSSTPRPDDFLGELAYRRWNWTQNDWVTDDYPLLFECVESGTFMFGPYTYHYNVYEATMEELPESTTFDGVTKQAYYTPSVQQYNNQNVLQPYLSWSETDISPNEHTFYQVTPVGSPGS